ncbi:hypothetical protein HYV57_00140 [Candidatus Peregrinibacteria bacterium]|nr:hypothetical protein [Candidatus Peregrinibacteria bacterium]
MFLKNHLRKSLKNILSTLVATLFATVRLQKFQTLFRSFFFVCIVLLVFLMPTQSFASEFDDDAELLSFLNAPKDLEPVIERNETIKNKANELQEILKNNAKDVREKGDNLDKIKNFLNLVIDNKLNYLDVLKKRIEKTTILTAEEQKTALKLIDGDIQFYTEKKSALSSLTDWSKIQALGEEVRSYSQTVAPRLRGLAGFRTISYALSLINRARRIGDRLQDNLNALSGTSQFSDYKRNLDAVLNAIQNAEKKVNEAKSIYFRLVQLESSASAEKAADLLKSAHLDLKEARKSSLTLTIDLIKYQLNTSE